mgnify:CR=1 FL=1
MAEEKITLSKQDRRSVALRSTHGTMNVCRTVDGVSP